MRKTHCKHGHDMSGAFPITRGKYMIRYCRECSRLRGNARYQTLKQARPATLPLAKANRRLTAQGLL